MLWSVLLISTLLLLIAVSNLIYRHVADEGYRLLLRSYFCPLDGRDNTDSISIGKGPRALVREIHSLCVEISHRGRAPHHYVDALHRRYGPIVRISPGEGAIADVDACAQIHKIGSGFLKSAWYDSTTGGREPGIFAMRDPQQHAARRRLFARAFSNSALQRNWEPDVRQTVKAAVSKIKEDAIAGEADAMKWWTLMATDITAHLAFGESFAMLELGKVPQSLPLSFSQQQRHHGGVVLTLRSKPRISTPSSRYSSAARCTRSSHGSMRWPG